MAHIEDRWKHGNDRNRLRWRARYTGPDGHEHARSFPKKTDARRWLDQQEAAKITRTWTDPALGRIRFRAWYQEWWPTVTNLRASTAARDGHYYRAYVLPRFGDVPLSAITQREVRQWVAELTGRGLEPATVHKAYQVLSKALRAAVDAELLAQTPCRKVTLPKIEQNEMRFLTPEEIGRLAARIDQRYRVLVLVGAYGGLRFGELAGLCWRHVDLAVGTVEVAEIVVEVEGRLYVGSPKTRSSRRRVSLPTFVAAELTRHAVATADRDASPAPDPDGRVFRAPRGGLLRINGFRRRVWSKATTAAGLDGLRIHDLRHTAVALWIAAGANPKLVAARAGHTSVSFTLDRYGHLFPDADERLRHQLDQFIRNARRKPTAPSRPWRRKGT